jgi:DNA polymerase III subunit gamma/tau
MAESYTVLARRYRSQTFDELVGQEAIAQTLKNAVRTGRVAHAFLFTGTRGVGKTSAARILAKAINCPNRTPEGNPCSECNSCKAIATGDDIDVIEIDGASNNSVDQIRDLRQSAGIRPARSPYKIYIIDEVHMLSGGAFNALLKTLEEPPEHVKFIFATTDIHKVPATIISRCQRFDFKNIATARIAAHLKAIIADEKITADDDALHRIARLGNGSMRDALSILDRVLSLGEKHVTDKTLEELLGKPATAAIAELVQALASADAGAALTRSDKLLQEGMGVEQILSELIDFFRNLMIVVACGPATELLDVPTESRAAYTTLAPKYDAAGLVHMIALGEQTLRSLKGSTMHRPLFDALIVRLAMSDQFTALRDLLAKTSAASSSNPPAAGQKKK